jgi:stalled ribosome rescue protein Dom34
MSKKQTNFNQKYLTYQTHPLKKEQTEILSLRNSYAIEKKPKKYINELIVDTEEPKIQNTYRYLAAKQIKQIINSNRHNIHHKRQQYNINQIKKILEDNNLTLVKADKSNAVVIINSGKLEEKFNEFIREKITELLNKDPPRRIPQTSSKIHPKSNILIDNRTHRYLMEIKPKAPQLNAYIRHIKIINP